MDVMEWMALIGAAAWTPQIISWLCKYFTRPKVTLYLHQTPQIGYTTFGPIFNVNLALLSERKDIVVNKFTANIKHENGASHTFEWKGISEDISQIQNYAGLSMSVKKTSLPLVIKLTNVSVSQLFVQFQSATFNKNLLKKAKPYIEQFNFQITYGQVTKSDDIDELTESKEFVDIIGFFKSNFNWQAGKYEVVFDLQSPNKFKYEKEKYVFTLNQQDIDDLMKNIDNAKTELRDGMMLRIMPKYEVKPINWVWKNPELQKNDM